MRILTIATAALIGAAAVTATLAEEKPLPKGAPVLTIAGKTANWNRGAVKPEQDAQLKQHDIRFERAMTFDADMLASMPQYELRIVTPAGDGTFSGPLLADVLKATGAEGAGIRLVGLDGADTTLKPEELKDQKWILALVGSGKAASAAGFGPIWLINKPATDMPSPADMDHWVSSVFYIEVL